MKRYELGKVHKHLKAKTRKIGRRSIYDIINDRPIELSFKEKLDYIRHHFTYYDGNHELFNDENGKPNIRKMLLNKIICSVIERKKSPKALKELNKKILRWRKDSERKTLIQSKCKFTAEISNCLHQKESTYDDEVYD